MLSYLCSDGGAVYVFSEIATDEWTLVASVYADDDDTAEFGAALSLHDDLMLVGAPACFGSGCAYLFQQTTHGDPSSWELVARLNVESPVSTMAFGAAVSIGENVFAVGAPFEADDGQVYAVSGKSCMMLSTHHYLAPTFKRTHVHAHALTQRTCTHPTLCMTVSRPVLVLIRLAIEGSQE